MKQKPIAIRIDEALADAPSYVKELPRSINKADGGKLQYRIGADRFNLEKLAYQNRDLPALLQAVKTFSGKTDTVREFKAAVLRSQFFGQRVQEAFNKYNNILRGKHGFTPHETIEEGYDVLADRIEALSDHGIPEGVVDWLYGNLCSKTNEVVIPMIVRGAKMEKMMSDVMARLKKDLFADIERKFREAWRMDSETGEVTKIPNPRQSPEVLRLTHVFKQASVESALRSVIGLYVVMVVCRMWGYFSVLGDENLRKRFLEDIGLKESEVLERVERMIGSEIGKTSTKVSEVLNRKRERKINRHARTIARNAERSSASQPDLVDSQGQPFSFSSSAVDALEAMNEHIRRRHSARIVGAPRRKKKK